MTFKEFLAESPAEPTKFGGINSGDTAELNKAKAGLAKAIAGNKKGEIGDAVVADMRRRVEKLEARGGKADTMSGKRTLR